VKRKRAAARLKYYAKKGRAVRRRRRRAPYVRRRYRKTKGRRIQPYNPFTELKFLNGNDNFTVQTAGTIVTSLNQIPEGTGRSERIGRKIIIKHISLRYTIRLRSVIGQANSSDIIRLIVYVDKQANGAAAAVTDILDTVLLPLTFQSFKNLANSGRFRILVDRKFPINALSSTDAVNFETRTYDRYYSKELNIPIEFDDTLDTGALSTIRTNNIGYLVIGREQDADFISTWRIRYQG